MKQPTDTVYHLAKLVIDALCKEGFQALFAGGCVRDMLLDRPPKDYDVATDATPDSVRKLFPRAQLVGAQFGVVIVRKKGSDIEVATFRKDGRYSDGRHPDDVTFGSAKDDAGRRDFTINGLFYDPVTDQVIDYVDGRSDIRAKVLRTIGDPHERFAEDYLRMLRAPRFAARLGFSIDSATAEAIRQRAANLRHISPERIWMELDELLTAPTRQCGFDLLVELGLHEHLTDTLNLSAERCGVISRTLGACGEDTIDPALSIAILLCGESRKHAKAVCRALRLSNRVTDDAIWMLDSLSTARDAATMELADLKLLMANRAWCNLATLLRAELIATRADLTPHTLLMQQADAIPESAIAPPPLLPGDQLITLGVSPGPRFGAILTAVYRAQLNEKIHSPGDAIDLAQRLLRENA